MKRYSINKTGFFNSFDNLNVKYGYYGDSGYERVLLLFPGRAEYIEKYHHIIDYFVSGKYLVFSMDWRGQGGSDRELGDADKGYVSDFSDYQKDLIYFINEIVLPLTGDKQIDVIAHSMGGHNIMRYCIENNNNPLKRVLLASPMLGINTYPLPESLAEFIAGAGVKMGFAETYLPGKGCYTETKFKNNPLTSDYDKFMENIEFLRANREYALGGPVYNWLDQAFISMRYLQNNYDKIDKDIKTLAVYGTEDSVVSQLAIEKASDHLSNGSVKIENGRHELMMENSKILNLFLELCDDFFEI